MNPTTILAAALGFLIATGGAYLKGRFDGREIESAVWQAREAAQLRSANAAIQALQEQARATEQRQASAVAAIATDYERKLSDAKKQRAADTAAVRAGALRLRDPYPARLGADGRGMPETAATPARRDGGAGGELSGEATQFLFDLAADADEVVIQLQACQAVIVADRSVMPH